MSKLAVWSIDERTGENDSQESEPKRVGRSSVGLERHLEDWIVNDVSLIGEGLTLVGRQVTIDDGRLDLLAIDSRDRWVVIELKAGMLYSDAMTQALSYAASLAMLDAKDLCLKLCNQFDDEKDFRWKVGERFDNQEAFCAKVKKQVENEGEEREIALMLVGAGISAGVERMSEFLGRFRIPIEIVSFEVFKPGNGPQLLVREVIEEPVQPPRPKRKYTVEAVRELAREAGVVKQLDRFMKMARRADLAVQPQMTSIRIAPSKDKRRLLLYVEPMPDATSGGDGKLVFYWEPDAFKKYYGIDEQEVEEGLGGLDDDRAPTGNEIDERLDRIEQFLTKHFPKADENERSRTEVI